MTVGEKSNQLLGEYLTDAGLLNIDDLREAANIARNQNLPIGKVLVMSGYLSKELLESTVELQAQVKDGQLDYKIALEALKLISQWGLSTGDALRRLHQDNAEPDVTNRLGELLTAACLISDTDLNNARLEGSRCGLPLGRVLVNLSMISESVLNNVLDMQSLVRNGKMTREEAIKNLLAHKEKQLENKEAIATKPVPVPVPAPKRSLTRIKKPGSTGNRISGQFPNLPQLSLHHMLRAAGLVDTAALEKAIQDSLENPEIMTAILKQANILEDFVIEAAKQSCQLIAQGVIKPEQAIIALHQCQRTRNSLHDCLIEFGWLQKSEVSL